ncbi:unnamed protein product [Cladocopium goreaui]|uniref:E3 ubiquitin-protein ligase HERC1 n=1 Tax=Cladocopium goreaui TaxID=2562237 RepID=A0A9P1FK74_9DINO|nr:unnamed protein product [Cladocopium goreaui]
MSLLSSIHTKSRPSCTLRANPAWEPVESFRIILSKKKNEQLDDSAQKRLPLDIFSSATFWHSAAARSVGPLCCGGICHRAPVDNVSIIPLKNVLGFSVEERFSMQRAMIVKLMAKACCRPMSESFLCVKVLSNAALGKVYLDSLSVRQRVLPLFADPPCNFEEDKVLELRRWLGNVALFFSGASEKVSQRPVLELWRCERGLAPE